MLKSGVIIVVAIYFAAGAMLYVLQRKLIYLPDIDRPVRAEYGATDMSEITYRTADGVELRSWYRAPTENGRPVLVYFHGNAGHIGHRVDKVRPYLDAGYGVLLAEYRGYGGNDGSPTEAGLYDDARAALDFLDVRQDENGPPILYGESLGSGVAVQMATERPVRALVLEAPFSSAVDMARRQFPIFPAGWLLRDRYDSVSKIGQVSAPILVLHGERDAVVPIDQGNRLLEATNPPREGVFIAEAGHNDLYQHGAADRVLDFLGTLVAMEWAS